MRILFLSQRVPYPPTKGDKLRAFHELKALAAHHEVDLFTLADDPEDIRHKPLLESLCRSVTITALQPWGSRLRALWSAGSGKPLTLPWFYSRDLYRQVRNALDQRSYDRIFVFCSSMFQYVPPASGIPAVVDLVDVDSCKWEQYARYSHFPFSSVYRREARLLREYERQLCESAACVVVTTDRESDRVRKLTQSARVQVLRNGVDTEYFHVKRQPGESAPAIVFTGDMSYFPNQQAAHFFARDVLPIVQKAICGARFLIVGRNPNRAVLRLALLDGVQVTGSVPDVRPFLAQAGVSVAPLAIAAGVQNKILEAMSCGVPVVATPLAVQGLSEATAAMVEISDTAHDLAAACIHLLRNPEIAKSRGEKCRRRVAVDYRWEHSSVRLLEIIGSPVETVTAKAGRWHANCL